MTHDAAQAAAQAAKRQDSTQAAAQLSVLESIFLEKARAVAQDWAEEGLEANNLV
jgi:hypothetical protein